MDKHYNEVGIKIHIIYFFSNNATLLLNTNDIGASEA